VNEVLDPSVVRLLEANAAVAKAPSYNPPNLWAYLTRSADQPPLPRPVYRHLDGVASAACLGLWLLLIAAAGWGVGGLWGGGWPAWLAVALPLVAGLADWREGHLNHQVALAPTGLRAERRLAWMDAYLAVRLGAIAAVVGGLAVVVTKIGPWLVLGSSDWRPIAALFGIDVLLLYFAGALAWSGAPMKEAGLASIVPLQGRRTPREVLAVLTRWADGDASEKGCALLTPPIARSLWRDILGFIPAYSVLLFVGTWLAWTMVESSGLPSPGTGVLWDLLSRHPHVWKIAALLTVGCALADWVEDAFHLGYLKSFPNPPRMASVRTALVATWVKFVLFFLGILATALAAAFLAGSELWQVLRLQKGGLSLLAAVATVVLFAFGVLDLLGRRRSERLDTTEPAR
jgi:hypothetical protein